MKQIILLIAAAMLATTVSAQTVLRLQSHGLLPNHKNDMKITQYAEPGVHGRNVIWNFTNLELKKDFLGIIEDAIQSKSSANFSQANVVLEEFGNYFYFKVTEAGIEHHGFSSSTGQTRIAYDVPFVKMRYPFAYGNSFNGDFSGRYFSLEKEIGTIAGSYEVKADGVGTLLLPGNVSYDNALRVKESKSYTRTLHGSKLQIQDETYRWYVNGHRFPLLTLIKSTYTTPDGSTSSTTLAAYNPVIIAEPASALSANSLAAEMGFSTYPNPFRDQINIKYSLQEVSNVNLSVFDLNGRLVRVLVAGTLSGDQNHRFSAKEMGFSRGAYIIKLNVNGVETTQKIVAQ